MAAAKKPAREDFFSNAVSTALSLDLANEYLRQAGITRPDQLSTDERVKPIREVVRQTSKRGRARRFRGLKRLARK